MHLPFNPGIGTCVTPLNAHRLQVTVDRLNRMTIRAHFDVVHNPGVRTHGRPAHRNQAHPRLRQDAGLISGALGGCIAQPPRPSGQARRTPQSPPCAGVRGVVRSCTPAGSIGTRTGTSSGRQTRCNRHPTNVSRFAAHDPQHARPRTFRQRRARTRRQTGRGRLSILNPSPVVNTSPNPSGIQAIPSAS